MAMTGTYKKRRRAFEGEEGRMQAVKRLQGEAKVRAELNQEKLVSRAKEPISHGPPQKQLEAANRMTGKRIPGHRLTFGQAISRRTTDTSRARVMKKYGVSGGPDRRYGPGLVGPRTGGRAMPINDGSQGAGLNQIAKMRQKVVTQNMNGVRRRRKLPSFGSNGKRRYL